MISTFGLLGRTSTLHIYAPEALENMLFSQIAMYCYDLSYQVEFHAVDTTRHQVIFEDRSLQVESIPLEHRMPTCGFLFREKPTNDHIRRDVADFYGIPVSQFNLIKAGGDWTTTDGMVIPHSQLTVPADPPRSYAYCSDTRYVPTLHERVKGVTALYHESTYGEDNMQHAEKYYHSTARQAAMVARDAQVGKLLLGHYSSRYEDENILLLEAKKVFDNSFLCDEQMIFEL
jgi:ribonuclease Z